MRIPSLTIRLPALAVLVFPGCDAETAPRAVPAADSTPDAPPDLPDEASERGLDYVNRSGRADKPTILEANGAGVALLDLGVDGDLDAVFGQGLGSLGDVSTGPGADLEVFANDGAGRFERAPGPGLSGWWTGLATGDVDGDGDADLVAGAFGDLVLCAQGPHGLLAPREDSGLAPADRLTIGERRRAGHPPPWVTSLALLDADRDGDLDLFVGRYLDLDPAAPPMGALGEGELAVPCRWKGHDVYCGPAGLVPQPDAIFRGQGDGTFEDATERWLPGVPDGYTLGVAVGDVDADGDTDLYVANDSSRNLLLINEVRPDGSGRFVERGYEAGVALSRDGAAEAGMGAAFADVNRDGLLDLVVTNFSDEPTELYFGSSVGFDEVTYRTGLSHETKRLLSWGCHLEDFDGDGWLELFTANGHVYPQADLPHTGTSYAQPDTLFRLGPSTRVERIAPASARSILALERGTRGTAVGDVDGDGALDLVLACIDAPAALGINRRGPGAHRLVVRLLGGDAPEGAAARTPPDGMGARLAVIVRDPATGAEHALLGETQTAKSFQSASTPWLHFGLGTLDHHAGLRVLWPSGRVEDVPPGPADRRLWIREGRGTVKEERLP